MTHKTDLMINKIVWRRRGDIRRGNHVDNTDRRIASADFIRQLLGNENGMFFSKGVVF